MDDERLKTGGLVLTEDYFSEASSEAPKTAFCTCVGVGHWQRKDTNS